MKYEVRGYCAKPHAAGRFLPFGSSMQEEGRFLATKPRSGTRGGRFPSDFDACGGFSQRNPRSPTDRRERAHGFRARTRFRGQKSPLLLHGATQKPPTATPPGIEASARGEKGQGRRRRAPSHRDRRMRQRRHIPTRARIRAITMRAPDNAPRAEPLAPSPSPSPSQERAK